eukprot:6208610-Pyramimonas_sp.AAC.1
MSAATVRTARPACVNNMEHDCLRREERQRNARAAVRVQDMSDGGRGPIRLAEGRRVRLVHSAATTRGELGP